MLNKKASLSNPFYWIPTDLLFGYDPQLFPLPCQKLWAWHSTFRMSRRGANGCWKPPGVQLAIRTVSSTHVMILPWVHALAWTSSGEWPPSSHEHAENTECNKVRVLVRNTLKSNGHVTKLGKGGGAQTGIRQIFLSRYNASWKKEDTCIYAKICMRIALDT